MIGDAFVEFGAELVADVKGFEAGQAGHDSIPSVGEMATPSIRLLLVGAVMIEAIARKGAQASLEERLASMERINATNTPSTPPIIRPIAITNTFFGSFGFNGWTAG